MLDLPSMVTDLVQEVKLLLHKFVEVDGKSWGLDARPFDVLLTFKSREECSLWNVRVRFRAFGKIPRPNVGLTFSRATNSLLCETDPCYVLPSCSEKYARKSWILLMSSCCARCCYEWFVFNRTPQLNLSQRNVIDLVHETNNGETVRGYQN